MTTEDFNALPLKARLFIENEIGCLTCGQKKDLDLIYKKYLTMKSNNLYVLSIGAVATKNAKGDVNVLYPISEKDSKEVLKEKLELALKINKVNPDSFKEFNEVEINKILKAKNTNEINNDKQTDKGE